MADQELRGLEPRRQGLADGLRNHPLTGETQPRARFGDDDVGQRREGGGDTTEGGVGDERQGEDPRLVELPERLAGLGHLHEGQDALLHAGATGGGHEQQRGPFPQRDLGCLGDGLTDRGAEAAAHEPEIHDSDDHRVTVDATAGADDRLVEPGGGARLPKSLDVGTAVDEPQRIVVGHDRFQQMHTVGVQQHREPFMSGQRGVPAAFRADPQGAGELLCVDDRPATATDQPGRAAGLRAVPFGQGHTHDLSHRSGSPAVSLRGGDGMYVVARAGRRTPASRRWLTRLVNAAPRIICAAMSATRLFATEAR